MQVNYSRKREKITLPAHFLNTPADRKRKEIAVISYLKNSLLS